MSEPDESCTPQVPAAEDEDDNGTTSAAPDAGGSGSTPEPPAERVLIEPGSRLSQLIYLAGIGYYAWQSYVLARELRAELRARHPDLLE
ncbi:hypothetical protein [Jatrophihabitans sp.]|uniref:hypothetical protein n=1 Tax=Jatrophihabitans sp. TaxID=1932789 RepID=UPI0030C660EA|nr:hypothetical protein [Jatrophihabitans sp.]